MGRFLSIHTPESPLVMFIDAIWNCSADLEPRIKNVTGSITDAIRSYKIISFHSTMEGHTTPDTTYRGRGLFYSHS